ncbi:MAG TPA: hypothetical protein VIF62_07630 [Labilithrix sp.]
MLTTWRSAVAPATIALLFAAGGELNAALGMLAMFVTLFATFFGVALIVAIPVNAVKRRPFVPAIVGLVACMAANVVATRVVFGVPLWVKADAAPSIAAIESWKKDHGRFPDELEAGALHTKCHYFANDGRPRLGCMGVAFTKCDYDFETKTWRGWD